MSDFPADINDDSIPSPEIQDILDELNHFIEESFDNKPLDLKDVLRPYPKALTICHLISKLFNKLCQLNNEPEVVHQDFDYAIQMMTDCICRSNTLSLSSSQRNLHKLDSSMKNLGMTHSSSNLSLRQQQSQKDEYELLKQQLSVYKDKLRKAEILLEQKDDEITKDENSHVRKISIQKIQVEKELEDLKIEYNSLKAKAFKEVNKFKISLSAQNDKIKVLETNLNDLEKENDELIKTKLSLEEQLNEAEIEVFNLQTINAKHLASDTITDNSAGFKGKDKNAKIEATLSLLEQNLHESTQKSSEQTMLTRLRSLVNKESIVIDNQAKCITGLESDIEDKNEIIKLKSDEINSLKQRIDEYITETQKQAKEIVQKNKDIASLNNQLIEARKSITAAKITQPVNNTNKEIAEIRVENLNQEIESLRATIDTLANFIDNLLFAEDRDHIPLVQGTAPIINDEGIKESIRMHIDSLKGRFDSYDDQSRDIIFIKHVFGDEVTVSNLVNSYIESGRTDYYALIIALCAANKRLLDFTNHQTTVLNMISKCLPSQYDNNDEGITLFIRDSQIISEKLMNISSKVYSEEIEDKDISHILRDINNFVLNVEGIRELLNTNETIDCNTLTLPLYIKDYINDLNQEFERVTEQLHILEQEHDSHFDDDMTEEHFDSRLNYSIDFTKEFQEFEDKTQKLADENSQLKGKVEDMQNDLHETEYNVSILKKNNEEHKKTINLLNRNKARLLRIIKGLEESFEKRLQERINESHILCDKEKEILSNKFKKEILILTETISNQNKKIENFKGNLDSLKKEFGEKVGRLQSEIEEYKENKEKLTTEIETLKVQNKILSSPTKSSYTSILEKIEMSPSTPERRPSTSSASSLSNSQIVSSNTPISEKNDRFAVHIGKILGKYYKQEKVWTRSKVILQVDALIDRVVQLEKKESPVNEHKLAEMIRQNNLWQTWGDSMAETIGVNTHTPEEVRVGIRNFILSTINKTTLLSKIQSLRAQKRLLIKYDMVNIPQYPHLDLKAVITTVLLCKKLKKQQLSSPTRNISSPKRPYMSRVPMTPK
ncbi:hypothetical protein TRFO_31011 [Tritrichomonas foetus]|uniref:Uncharacterized protein n=1 Tax=Tritrichomonas foetus TaxID=1144522 RepID=A0A1J4JTC7_9EUKA|nr:hypothetical protein TRFO_31011 [Tritrichomonas foetus]|eukprot:OHT01994.1 hypothetical protein TRFO_31011 [Tritrichomonas foetus]